MIRILDSTQVGKLLARKAARFAEAEATVRPILEAVRKARRQSAARICAQVRQLRPEVVARS